MGRRRRADDLCRSPGGAQRLLRGDRKAHPFGSAEEREDLLGMTVQAAAAKAAASHFDRGMPMKAQSAIAVVALVLSASFAFAADPPPGAAACSGCHTTNAAAESPVPKIHGRNADEIVAAMAAFRSGAK